ncbi:MAG: hypothetical protein ABI831_07700 [Betaproteobacteria bacterium]
MTLSDEGARYSEVIAINCAALSPMVAAPGDPGNAVSIHTLSNRTRIDSRRNGFVRRTARPDGGEEVLQGAQQ